MQIEKRTMGWLRKPSAYQYNQQLNAKRRAQAQNYLNEQTALSTAIFSAKDNMSYSLTELTLKSLAKKLQAEAKEKIDKGLNDIDETRASLKTDIKAKSASTDEDDDADSVDKTV